MCDLESSKNSSLPSVPAASMSFVDGGCFLSEIAEPVEIAFENITYEIKVKKETRTIINGVSGKIPAGAMAAVLGASGAGKTTMLNILSGRIDGHTGKVFWNGKEIQQNEILSSCAFIQQDDLFFGILTPEEHLQIQAHLRLPRSVKKVERNSRVRSVLQSLGLVKCKGTKIGGLALNYGRGISGGEKKRLNIATELLVAPTVIMGDEVTSGLDSYVAYNVVAALREFADTGRTIISTIHQPSNKVFDVFDYLLVMADGRIVYAGDRVGSIEWFSRLGQICPVTTNPAEFIIKIIAMSDPEKREHKVKEIERWSDTWKEKGEFFLVEWGSGLRHIFLAEQERRTQTFMLLATSQNDNLAAATQSKAEGASADVSPPTAHFLAGAKPGSSILPSPESGRHVQSDVCKKHPSDAVAAGSPALTTTTTINIKDEADRKITQKNEKEKRITWITHLWILFTRALICDLRNPTFVFVKLMHFSVFSAIQGFLYFRLSWSVDDSAAKMAAAHILLLNLGMTGAMTVVSVVPQDAPIIRSEHRSNTISVPLYINARMLADLPSQLLSSVISFIIVYYLIGFNDKFIRFILSAAAAILSTFVSISIGYLASCISKTPRVAIPIVQTILFPLIIANGFVVKLSDIPKFWIWLEYISFYRYSFSAFVRSVFHDQYVHLANGSTILGDTFLNTALGLDVSRYFYIWSYIALVILLISVRVMATGALTLVMRRDKKRL